MFIEQFRVHLKTKTLKIVNTHTHAPPTHTHMHTLVFIECFVP